MPVLDHWPTQDIEALRRTRHAAAPRAASAVRWSASGPSEEVSMIELEGLPSLNQPIARGRLRGLERRCRGGHRARRPPAAALPRRALRRRRPGGLLRLPGQPPGHLGRRPRCPRDHLAGHRGLRHVDLRTDPTSSWSAASSPACGGAPSSARSSAWPSSWTSTESSPSALCWPTPRTPDRCRSPRSPPTRRSPSGSGVELTRYEGPTGIVGALTEGFTRAGIETLSFWAAVPHYVAQSPCPKATLALLRALEDALDLSAARRRPRGRGGGVGARRRRARARRRRGG